MIARPISLALALAMLAAGPALAQPLTYWTGGVVVYEGHSQGPGSPPAAAFHVQVGPVEILVPEALVYSGSQLTNIQQENGVLQGVETACAVCDGPCDPPALNNARGWASRIDPIDTYQAQGGSQGNISYSGGPWSIAVYMLSSFLPEDMTHYWCGNFLWGLLPPLDSAGSPLRVLPDYGTSLPPWARLGVSGSTVQSGALPFK